MDINFFDNPADAPKMREDVRITRTRFEVSPEARRVAVDVELTPFIERPTLQLLLFNERDEPAGRLTIIETLDRVISVVMHIRDKQPTSRYQLRVTVYYASVDTEMKQQVVDVLSQTFALEPGNVVMHNTSLESNQPENKE